MAPSGSVMTALASAGSLVIAAGHGSSMLLMGCGVALLTAANSFNARTRSLGTAVSAAVVGVPA